MDTNDLGEVLKAIPHAIDRIIMDLKDRQGLKHEWRHIEADIQDEIAQTWQRIVEDTITERMS